jgi:hypothetical protein
MTRAFNHNFNEITKENNNQRLALRRETAQYISDMLLELRHLAKGNAFHALQGLLEISYYEAFNEANKVQVPEGEADLLHALGADARKSFVA